MYHPTTRVLTILELLQSHRALSGPEIAERLEVDIRTVRRYVAMLQDLGIPVEGERGRYGRYRLRPGFKLPPLMFNEDEALAITLGLLITRRIGMGVAAPAVEGALAKVEQVMPDTLRQRVRAIQDTLIMDIKPSNAPPESDVVLALSTSIQARRRVWLKYRAYAGEQSEREFDPYGLVFRDTFWYTVGWCHLRNALRTFRVDRILEIAPREATFTPPEHFDSLREVEKAIARTPGMWWVDVLLDTDLATVDARVPRELSTLEEEPGGVALRCYVQDIDWFAVFVLRIGVPFVIREPDELRAALRRLAERATEMAGRR